MQNEVCVRVNTGPPYQLHSGSTTAGAVIDDNMALVFPPAPDTTTSGVFASSTSGVTAAGVSGGSFATSVAGAAPVPAGAFAGATVSTFFAYQPSFLIALIGTIFFSITMTVHVAQLLRCKSWYFALIPQAALRMSHHKTPIAWRY